MAIKWAKIYSDHKGKWVALEKDESTVIGFGKTAREAYDKAQKKGFKNPILTKVPLKLDSIAEGKYVQERIYTITV